MQSRKEMKALVDEIIDLGNELRRYHELDDKPAKAFPAPTKNTFDSFKRCFVGKIPSSYLQLMSIYNGIENFEWVDVSILSIEFLMENDDLDEDWVDAGWYGKGDLFIFAQSDSDAHVLAFLIKTVDDDVEMKVLHFDTEGPLGEYKNFEEYLKDRRNWFKQSLATEKADREGLTDDE